MSTIDQKIEPIKSKAVGRRRGGTRSVLVWKNFKPKFKKKKKSKNKTDLNWLTNEGGFLLLDDLDEFEHLLNQP